jgi:hypothetical protein
VSDKLLTLHDLRIALVGPGCPFRTPPSRSTILSWVKHGLKRERLPGGKRWLYRLSFVLEFLKQQVIE